MSGQQLLVGDDGPAHRGIDVANDIFESGAGREAIQKIERRNAGQEDLGVGIGGFGGIVGDMQQGEIFGGGVSGAGSLPPYACHRFGFDLKIAHGIRFAVPVHVQQVGGVVDTIGVVALDYSGDPGGVIRHVLRFGRCRGRGRSQTALRSRGAGPGVPGAQYHHQLEPGLLIGVNARVEGDAFVIPLVNVHAILRRLRLHAPPAHIIQHGQRRLRLAQRRGQIGEEQRAGVDHAQSQGVTLQANAGGVLHDVEITGGMGDRTG